ncbi:MAG: hypothetical protein K6G16_03835 [Lachnospiraceae bacterium]|nr:hypothetical protein [Lachnospiraceae bacterium]
MARGRIKTDRMLLLWFAATVVWNMLSQILHISWLATISYMLLCVFWLWSLRREIPDRRIRYRLDAGGILLILLFVLRTLRYALPLDPAWDHLCWYAYYIPILGTPLLSLSLSLMIADRRPERHRRLLWVLRILWGLLVVLVLTNDLHAMVYRVWVADGRQHSSATPLYYVYILWYIGLTLASFLLMLYKCRISAARRLWWIPVLAQGAGLIPWFVYYAVCTGASPSIGGISLYNIQEIFLLLFIGLWESCLLIGLVPSSSLIRERAWIREGVRRAVSDELTEVRKVFGRINREADTFHRDLIRLGCLGAYIKRRANLELIADERGCLSTTELSLAIRESFEYYALAGMSVGYEETGNAEVPALLVISAYELFERILERTAGRRGMDRPGAAGSSGRVAFRRRRG